MRRVGKNVKVCMLAYATYYTDARIKAYVKSLEGRGIETDVIALKENDKTLCESTRYGRIYYLTKKYQGKCSFKYIISYLWFFFNAFLKVSFLYIENKYDVIHVHNMPNFIILAAIIPKIFGAKIILDVHDLMTANYMTKFGADEGHILIRILKIEQIISAKFANHVICADHKQREKLIEYGIPAAKVTVMLNVANEEIFKPVVGKKDLNRLDIIYHGTIAERLGIDILLRAIAKIKNQIPTFLSIYGDGDFLQHCLALKNELGLDRHVYFSQSFFSVEKVPEIVSTMDVGVVPYRRTLATDELGMSVKLMEYVYLQIPVIAPRLQIIRRYFEEDMLKFFEPDSVEDLARAIVELYENPEERENLVLNANKFIEKYNWKSQEKEYDRLLTTFMA